MHSAINFTNTSHFVQVIYLNLQFLQEFNINLFFRTLKLKLEITRQYPVSFLYIDILVEK